MAAAQERVRSWRGRKKVMKEQPVAG